MSNPENSTLPPEKSGPPPEPVNSPELPQYSYYPPAPNPTINPPVYVNTPGLVFILYYIILYYIILYYIILYYIILYYIILLNHNFNLFYKIFVCIEIY